MILKKKWLAIFALITAVVILGACGDNEKAGVNPVYDNPRNHTAEDFMPISKGLEKYPVWILTDEDPVRDSSVRTIYVFKKDKATVYDFNDGDFGNRDVVIEDILDMSDKELIKFAEKTATKQYDDYENGITNKKYYNAELFTAIQKEFYSHLENFYGEQSFKEMAETFKDLKPMTEDIFYNIEGERPKHSGSTYTLDIKIDDLGQYTESMELVIPKATSKLVRDVGSVGLGEYVDFFFFDEDVIFLKSEDKEKYNDEIEDYVESLKRDGHFEQKDGYGPNHPQNFVPNPYVWETKDEQLTIKGTSFNQKIFDTTFSGIKTDNRSFVTRVDDSFVGFRLDDPDTKRKNVTIEGK